ncbi:MAG: hypothetical protein KGZ97_09680 [Bacteroidetes bacterium]|nr:hypothetical protein [Bacteroidota bacterium]
MLKIKRIDADLENFGEIWERYLEIMENKEKVFMDRTLFRAFKQFVVDLAEEPADRDLAMAEVNKLSVKELMETINEIGKAGSEPAVPLES